MVKVRLQREGKKKAPFYHIVVADSKSPRDGKIIEQIGTYDPSKGIESVSINEELAVKWLKSGAQYSDTVKNILSSKGLISKAKEEKAKEGIKKANVTSTKNSK